MKGKKQHKPLFPHHRARLVYSYHTAISLLVCLPAETDHSILADYGSEHDSSFLFVAKKIWFCTAAHGYMLVFCIIHELECSNCASIKVSTFTIDFILQLFGKIQHVTESMKTGIIVLLIHNLLSKKGFYLKIGFIVALAFN